MATKMVWLPVEGTVVIGANGKLYQVTPGVIGDWQMPDDVRICRLVEVADDAPVVPKSVRRYLIEICDYHRDEMLDTLDMMVKAYGSYDRDNLQLAVCEAALAWLKETRTNGT